MIYLLNRLFGGVAGLGYGLALGVYTLGQGVYNIADILRLFIKFTALQLVTDTEYFLSGFLRSTRELREDIYDTMKTFAKVSGMFASVMGQMPFLLPLGLAVYLGVLIPVIIIRALAQVAYKLVGDAILLVRCIANFSASVIGATFAKSWEIVKTAVKCVCAVPVVIVGSIFEGLRRGITGFRVMITRLFERNSLEPQARRQANVYRAYSRDNDANDDRQNQRTEYQPSQHRTYDSDCDQPSVNVAPTQRSYILPQHARLDLNFSQSFHAMRNIQNSSNAIINPVIPAPIRLAPQIDERPNLNVIAAPIRDIPRRDLANVVVHNEPQPVQDNVEEDPDLDLAIARSLQDEEDRIQANQPAEPNYPAEPDPVPVVDHIVNMYAQVQRFVGNLPVQRAANAEERNRELVELIQALPASPIPPSIMLNKDKIEQISSLPVEHPLRAKLAQYQQINDDNKCSITMLDLNELNEPLTVEAKHKDEWQHAKVYEGSSFTTVLNRAAGDYAKLPDNREPITAEMREWRNDRQKLVCDEMRIYKGIPVHLIEELQPIAAEINAYVPEVRVSANPNSMFASQIRNEVQQAEHVEIPPQVSPRVVANN